MYTGTLAAASNRADLQFTSEIIDNDSGDAIDLTGATITLGIRDQETKCTILTGTNSDGHITVTGTGTFLTAFTPAEMKALCAGSYDLGVTIKLANGITFQIIAGVLPVIDGVVSP